MKLAKIKEHENLVKDLKSGAILLSNKTPINEYTSRKRMMQNDRSMNNEINTVKQEVNEIKSDLKEIKELLQRMLGK